MRKILIVNRLFRYRSRVGVVTVYTFRSILPKSFAHIGVILAVRFHKSNKTMILTLPQSIIAINIRLSLRRVTRSPTWFQFLIELA